MYFENLREKTILEEFKFPSTKWILREVKNVLSITEDNLCSFQSSLPIYSGKALFLTALIGTHLIIMVQSLILHELPGNAVVTSSQ